MNDFAVIFDMDGVISHTNPHHADAFRAFFKTHNIRATDEDFEEHMYGKHNSYIFKHFFQRELTALELQDFEEQKEGLFRELYAEKVEALPGFIDFLKSLKENNIKTGIATSAPEANLKLIAEKLNLYKDMESVLYSEKTKKHKPDPEIYLRSAANLGVKPENCLVFEDSASGIKAGQAAGMQVCAVLTTHTKAQLPRCNWYISDFQGLDYTLVREWMEGK